MQGLIQWTNKAFEEDTLHPLLIIAVFIYEFLSIHPFQDGNGRLSRLMTTLLLLKQGYDFVLFTSFENLIEERKRDYYSVLMDGQQKRGQTESPEIIDKWVVFFLDSLLTLTQILTEKRQVYITLKDYLNERQKQVLDFLMKNSPVQLSGISQYLPHISRATLKRDLSVLVERRLLTQVGKGKGVRYFAVYQSPPQ